MVHRAGRRLRSSKRGHYSGLGAVSNARAKLVGLRRSCGNPNLLVVRRLAHPTRCDHI